MKRLIYKLLNSKNFDFFNWDIDFNKKIKDTCFVVFDTETTGLDLKKDYPISIGAVKIKNLSFSFSEAFYENLRAPKRFEESIKVHGITPMDLQEGISVEAVCKKFLEYAKGCLLVGFFVHIDVSMLRKIVKDGCKGAFLPYTLDVLDLYTPKKPHHIPTLGELLEDLKLPKSTFHNALDDAYMTALAFLKLIKPYQERPLKSLPIKV